MRLCACLNALMCRVSSIEIILGFNNDHKGLKIQLYYLQRFGALLHLQVIAVKKPLQSACVICLREYVKMTYLRKFKLAKH